MLAGIQDIRGALVPQGMAEPSPDDMEKAAEAALYSKQVVFENFEVKTFDLSKPKDTKEYSNVVKALYVGAKQQTHLILYHERKFVEDPTHQAGGPRWIVHLEWIRYSFKKTANPVVGSQLGVDDAQASP